MQSPEWGVFRLKGVLSRKKVKARPVNNGQWAVTERLPTGKTVKGGEHDTCMTQAVIDADEFLDHYVAVDPVAQRMLNLALEPEPVEHPSQAPTVYR